MKTLALAAALIGSLSVPVMAEPIALSDAALDNIVAGSYTVVYPGLFGTLTITYDNLGIGYSIPLPH